MPTDHDPQDLTRGASGTSLPPPPPPAPVTEPAPYRSGRSLATVVRVLLVGAIVVTGFDAAANVDAAQLIDRLQADANSVTLVQLEASDARTAFAVFVQLALLLTAFGFLIAWTSRLYRNLLALGSDGLRFTQGWAIGGWFIPFFNLVRPKQIVDDIWRGSGRVDGDHDDWRRRKVTPLLHWWWGSWILAVVLSRASAVEPTDLESAGRAAATSVVADVVLVVAGVLAIAVVTRLTDRQERTAGRATAGGRSRWVLAGLLSPLASIAVFGASLAVLAAVDDGQPSRAEGSSATASFPSEAADGGRRTVLPLGLRPGDCIDDPPVGAAADEPATVLALEVVDCRTPHDEEVIARLVHPADGQAEFPGDQALIRHADEACLDQFEPWVGQAYDDSPLELGYLWPQAASWARGERTIICTVAGAGGQPLVGTVRDSAR